MNKNIDSSNSTKETELKCSLCKEPFFTEKDEEMTKGVIDGSTYFFHTQKCFNVVQEIAPFLW